MAATGVKLYKNTEAVSLVQDENGRVTGVNAIAEDGSELTFTGKAVLLCTGGFGGYQVLMVGGVKKYRAYFFPKAKASIPDWTGNTKGSSISFATQPISMKIMPPEFGPWYYIKEFDTESAAKAYVDAKLGVATWYTVNVQVNGADGTEAASPVGMTAVASGSSFVITITGTVTKLYDNGTDKTSSIDGGTYTIASIAANHDVAVIF